ncbi:tRNA-specific 2-thiouridylase mnmA [Spirochaeta thermophila DSM 6578]|uniref:tRNA-specific 2-thiouridylase MnmA n=1 Tax=Winmispira thermophila (strain ATCC 700085 / DSM 6578 / Z-1203) TaxID=869211 RepID=G0GF05_WINT7|nr:tRNA 2-thiouridine(34) synthase MnmA [Spirochaeta thermophila]AEJ62349.1 tRNA-specific 2-thiouridylase mnmA [Spirochaeta thermophila DSM 6578]
MIHTSEHHTPFQDIRDTRRPRRLVVAMSGGVDSSVTAHLLLSAGIEVVGLTFIRVNTPAEVDHEGFSEEARAAREVASHLGIEHHVLNLHDLYTSRVLRRAWEEYRSGRTPNPCVLCNRTLKFGHLVRYAREVLRADGIATGHYARIYVDAEGCVHLLRGKAGTKEQSYFLAQTRPEDLRHAYFPLGDQTKNEIRTYARHHGIPTAERPESQDVCFNTTGLRFGEFLQEFFEEGGESGPILDERGNVLGRHRGIHVFTIGQRRGLGVALGRPVYVKAIDPERNAVIVTDREEALLHRVVEAAGVNWFAPPPPRPMEVLAQIRYAHRAAPAVLTHEGDRIRVRFHEPQRAVTPGQLLVAYVGDEVLCSGFILQTEEG